LGGDGDGSWRSLPEEAPWPIEHLLDPGKPDHNLYAAEAHMPGRTLPKQHQIRVLAIEHKLSIIGTGVSLEEDVKTTVEHIYEGLHRAQVRRI
jgi:hypothetical protein